MYQSLSMFLAPENPVAQATMTSPPAVEIPGSARPKHSRHSLRFMAALIGNTIGFGTLLAGCWFSLQMIRVLLAQYVV